ncbi:carboxylesterase 3 [Echinops telfairi]|uniref:Carboxylesterase 3 n=1 Tax=Echinops telfairi TaxID=9371 RepID=A0AC55DDM4_ECHTE|nr:carboxylesterase 3 [Echinops telfairi]
MEITVRVRVKAPVWVACLLLALPTMAADKPHLSDPGDPQPEVLTTQGRVRGRQVAVKGVTRLVDVFLGIPYAQAPVGPGRFSAPRPVQPWEGVRDVSREPPMCLQDVEKMNNSRFLLNGKHRVFSISEDCLLLNIYRPAGAAAGPGRPVMVWVHGGAFMTGAATSQDGSALAAFGDVVVVTVQYRLGIPGFLSTGDSHAPGNWGFLDVVAALRWVQGNISPFGGDPNCVTIFGGSAGAMIVSALVLSPLAQGLFHRAIAQSGVITIPGFLNPNPLSLAQAFADSVACSSSSSAEMLQCLRLKTGEDMVLTKESQKKMNFLPNAVDGTFFPKSPKELLAEKQFRRVPCLLGVTNHEMSWLLPRAWGILDQLEQMSPEDMLTTLRPLLANMDIPPELMRTTIDEYVGNSWDPGAKRDAFLDLLNDGFFNFPVLNFARSLRGELYFTLSLCPTSQSDPGTGASSSFLAFPEATEEEKQLSLTMMAQWTQFARTGDPNGVGLPSWPLFTQSEQYLQISPEPRTGQKLRGAWMQLWAEMLPTKSPQWEQKKDRPAQEEL